MTKCKNCLLWLDDGMRGGLGLCMDEHWFECYNDYANDNPRRKHGAGFIGNDLVYGNYYTGPEYGCVHGKPN